MNNTPNTIYGFTLVELSIVLVILGLLIGSLLTPLSARIENERRTENRIMLNEVRDALLGFAIVNGRLPCPDTSATPDGIEDACPAASNVANAGMLPYATLGVSAKNDPWGQGHPVRYRVNGAFSAPAISLASQSTASGILNIFDAATCAGPANPVALNVPALVWTEAKSLNVGSNDEDENSDADTCYVNQSYSSVIGAEFDDQLVWIPSSLLFNRLVSAGVLP